MKELTEKKKEVGKSPRKSQAVSNKFTIPIPKIRGSSTTTTMTNAVFEHNPNDNNLSQAVFPSPVQPLSPVPGLGDAGDAPTMTGVMAPGPGPYINSAESEEDYDHPRFHLPPLDLDLLLLNYARSGLSVAFAYPSITTNPFLIAYLFIAFHTFLSSFSLYLFIYLSVFSPTVSILCRSEYSDYLYILYFTHITPSVVTTVPD